MSKRNGRAQPVAELDRAAVVADFNEAMQGLATAAGAHADRTFAEIMEIDTAELPPGQDRDDLRALASAFGEGRMVGAMEASMVGAGVEPKPLVACLTAATTAYRERLCTPIAANAGAGGRA